MKTIKFHDLFLLSQSQESAAHIEFDATATIITGTTSAGKSCILKSLFLVFGAEIRKRGILFSENPYILLKFSVDDTYFYILRKQSGYSVFDQNGHVLITTTEVTKGLAPFLNELFDIRAKLINNNDNSLIPFLPGHIFSPFYIDQDSGWEKAWESFSRIDFVKDCKKNLINFYTGIKSLETYGLEVERLEAQQNVSKLNSELVATNKILAAFNETHMPATFNPDPTIFASEIDSLTKECDLLLKQEQIKKEELSDISDQLSRIDLELQATSQLLGNLEVTAENALKSDEHFDCPLCGSIKDNFFEIALRKLQDRKNYEEFLSELAERHGDVLSKRTKVLAQLKDLKAATNFISTILATKKESVTLDDFINEAGRRRYFVQLKTNIAELQKNILDQEKIIKKNTLLLRKLAHNSADMKKKILNRYHELMLGFTSELEAAKITDKQLANPYSDMSSASGNENSRCVLAYFYAIITLSHEIAQPISVPIVIDTPLQQDPDARRGQKIMQFLSNHKPVGRQIIIATSKDFGVDFGGKVIQMDENGRYNLLRKEEYPRVEPFFREFIKQHTDNMLKNKAQIL